MHFALANHVRQRNAQFGSAHGACERYQHFPVVVVDELFVSFRGGQRLSRVVMAKVSLHKLCDCHLDSSKRSEGDLKSLPVYGYCRAIGITT